MIFPPFLSTLSLGLAHFVTDYCTMLLYFVYIMASITILKVILAQESCLVMGRMVRDEK